MKNDVCSRLKEAVDFLKKNGYVKNNAVIAKRLGATPSTLSMAINGSRPPSCEFLLDFCDAYPINFWWLRSGDGNMIKSDREAQLLRRIEELEGRIMELEKNA